MALTPLLMFTGRAEEAMRFYVATFPDAEILALDRYGPEEPEREGTVRSASFRIADETLRCIDSPDIHEFGFTPAVSFCLDCPDDATLDRLFDQLATDGTVFMAPDRYSFAQRFTWLADRFGVAWQLRVTVQG